MTDRFSRRQRREIAGRARTLHERLAGPPNDPGGDPPDVDRLFEEWRDLFPDEESFETRLAREGLTEETLREQASATRWPADEPLPDWIADLESLLDHVVSAGPDPDLTATVPGDLAFRELLAPIAGYALERLPEVGVPEVALEPLVEWLLDRLEALTMRVLYVEFRSYLRIEDPDLAAADPEDFEEPPTANYQRFVAAMFDGGLANLCLEYPVLAHHLTGTVDRWVAAVTELCRRLEADRPALNDRFAVDGEVTTLEPLAEDAHAGGRVPVRLGFESGSVVYKPRDVRGGMAFHGVLDRLDDHLPTPSFETPTYLPRDGYGWMEWIPAREPADVAAVERYYRRAGVVACLAYALNVVDCQFENVVAAGERPTVVDGETVFHPWIDPADRPFSTPITGAVARSVLSTGLIPFWSGDEENEAGEYVAGFGTGSDEVPVSDRSRPTIDAANTDVMSVDSRAPTVDRSGNTPSIDGEDHPPSAHVEPLLDGFERAYETIQGLQRDGRFVPELVEPAVPEGTEVRAIYRSTGGYHALVRSACGRDPLRDGAWLTVELEPLTVPFFTGQIDSGDYWPLVAAERRALRRLDVPRFAATPGDATARHDERSLPATFDEPGSERARRRLAAFDSRDRACQAWLLRRSYTTTSPPDPPPAAAPVDDERLLREAVDLFEDVIEATVEAPGDDWVVVTSRDPGVELTPAGNSLYLGRAGVALAASGLYAATGEDGYRRVAVELLEPVVESVADPFDLGGGEGVGSAVYALTVAADLLDDPRYADRAAVAARGVTDDRLAADDAFDVLEGSAGTLLALLAHYERHGGEEVLDRAVAAGDRLLDARTTVGEHRVWETIESAPLTGISHGSAGIAYALARLSAVAGDGRYVEAVRNALAFEAELFDPERTNWAYGWTRDEYLDQWCHGRSGIALARVGIAEATGEVTLPTRPADVLPAIAAAEPTTLDDLCCGNVARIEALLEGASHADRDRSAARELAGRCLARRERDGELAQHGRRPSPPLVNPSFFKGLSGVVYALLRLRDPDLPCVARFE